MAHGVKSSEIRVTFRSRHGDGRPLQSREVAGRFWFPAVAELLSRYQQEALLLCQLTNAVIKTGEQMGNR